MEGTFSMVLGHHGSAVGWPRVVVGKVLTDHSGKFWRPCNFGTSSTFDMAVLL